ECRSCNRSTIRNCPYEKGRRIPMPFGEEPALSGANVGLPPARINFLAAAFFLIPAIAGGLVAWTRQIWWAALAGVFVGWLLSLAPKIARQWEQGVMLRLGRYIGLRGPGLFWIIPLVDTVTTWIDRRTITTNFAAE